MKHKGTVCDFTDERNDDLMRAYRDCLASTRHNSADEVYAQVACSPSIRFWVSESRAAVVVSEIDRGLNDLSTMTPNKREMFKEIYRRVVSIREQNPGISNIDAVFRAVNSAAPSFYLTPGTTQVLIGRIKKCYRKQKKFKSYR